MAASVFLKALTGTFKTDAVKANHTRSKAAGFHEQPGPVRLFDGHVIQNIRIKKGICFALLFSFDQLLGFEPMLQSSPLGTSFSKVNVIRKGFNHSMLG